jgi:hypothetical protein
MVSETRVINPKIIKLATANMFFEVFDCLVNRDRDTGQPDFGPKYRQLRFTMLNHKQKVNGKSSRVNFSMQERDFLLIRNLILSRKLGKSSDGDGIQLYRGSANKDYETGQQSRIFTIERQTPSSEPFKPDAGNKWKILVTIQNGPGVKGKTGQVMPAKGGTPIKLMFPIDEGVAISMVEEVYLYLQGFHSSCHKWIKDAHIAWADYAKDDDAVLAELDETLDLTEEDVETTDVF